MEHYITLHYATLNEYINEQFEIAAVLQPWAHCLQNAIILFQIYKIFSLIFIALMK